MGDGGRT